MVIAELPAPVTLAPAIVAAIGYTDRTAYATAIVAAQLTAVDTAD